MDARAHDKTSVRDWSWDENRLKANVLFWKFRITTNSFLILSVKQWSTAIGCGHKGQSSFGIHKSCEHKRVVVAAFYIPLWNQFSLIFLHSSNTCSLHGQYKPRCVPFLSDGILRKSSGVLLQTKSPASNKTPDQARPNYTVVAALLPLETLQSSYPAVYSVGECVCKKTFQTPAGLHTVSLCAFAWQTQQSS